ncbi:hypothetical protein M2454_002294 [Aequitasia blattaphilus]|uniref:IS91 family transposase n=1 Tax=Aequitasia blattaphilus TaxID=2949332 RepID=UPI003D1E52FF
MNILQRIFTDYFEVIKYSMHPRDVEMENIEKMIHCGDPSFGGAMYACDCGEIKFVPFRCKSRFCTSCGNMYSIDRTTSMSFKLIHMVHRHCVFTIPEELRDFFLRDRSLLNCLFSSVRSVLLRMFHNINKSQLFTPGFICVLHTFGRDLKWNPHIHCLISEGGIGKSGMWRKVSHFNFKRLGNSFLKVKSDIYRNCPKGFYVYAKPNNCNPNDVFKYIGRYLGRPVIATSRIDSYDGERVTFHYHRHEDDKLVTECIPATEFISRLIRHIPEKHFKMIRYYGIYARHYDNENPIHRAIPKEKHQILLSFNKWRESILSSFGYDPLKCPKCGKIMFFVELYFNHKSVSLQELYERIMKKSRVPT